MREMGPHSQGDSRRLCRWRDIASNTRGRISNLAVPLPTLQRKNAGNPTKKKGNRLLKIIGASARILFLRARRPMQGQCLTLALAQNRRVVEKRCKQLPNPDQPRRGANRTPGVRFLMDR